MIPGVPCQDMLLISTHLSLLPRKEDMVRRGQIERPLKITSHHRSRLTRTQKVVCPISQTPWSQNVTHNPTAHILGSYGQSIVKQLFLSTSALIWIAYFDLLKRFISIYQLFLFIIRSLCHLIIKRGNLCVLHAISCSAANARKPNSI